MIWIFVWFVGEVCELNVVLVRFWVCVFVWLDVLIFVEGFVGLEVFGCLGCWVVGVVGLFVEVEDGLLDVLFCMFVLVFFFDGFNVFSVFCCVELFLSVSYVGLLIVDRNVNVMIIMF